MGKHFLHNKSTGKFLSLKGEYLQSKYSNLARNQIRQDFMSVLVTCKSDEDRIKTEGVNIETSLATKFSSLKGK